MPEGPWSGEGIEETHGSDPRDMAKAGLLEVQSPFGEYSHPPE